MEGEGAAKITDVIFNTAMVTKETSDPQEEGSSKREHQKMVEEIGERQKELRHLQLKEEVLKREKELLAILASHACKVQAVKEGVAEQRVVYGFCDSNVTGMQDFLNRYTLTPV